MRRDEERWKVTNPELLNKDYVISMIRGKPQYMAAQDMEIDPKTLRKVLVYHHIMLPGKGSPLM